PRGTPAPRPRCRRRRPRETRPAVRKPPRPLRRSGTPRDTAGTTKPTRLAPLDNRADRRAPPAGLHSRPPSHHLAHAASPASPGGVRSWPGELGSIAAAAAALGGFTVGSALAGIDLPISQ